MTNQIAVVGDLESTVCGALKLAAVILNVLVKPLNLTVTLREGERAEGRERERERERGGKRERERM